MSMSQFVYGNPGEAEQYCPVCGHVIKAMNVEEVTTGEHDGYIFVHDDIEHTDLELEALQHGIN